MTNKQELLPCPFCGGKACLSNGELGGYTVIYIECIKCSTQTSTFYEDESEKAIEAWNKRAEDDKYKKLLSFVESIAHESVYEKYENLNELNWDAFDILKEIGDK